MRVWGSGLQQELTIIFLWQACSGELMSHNTYKNIVKNKGNVDYCIEVRRSTLSDMQIPFFCFSSHSFYLLHRVLARWPLPTSSSSLATAHRSCIRIAAANMEQWVVLCGGYRYGNCSVEEYVLLCDWLCVCVVCVRAVPCVWYSNSPTSRTASGASR